MSYCSVSDIKLRLSEKVFNAITLKPGTNLQNTDIDIDKIIDNAMSIIDIYLRKYYVLPILNIPYILTDICVSICVYSLYERIGQAEMKPDIVKAYDRAINQLEKINNLELILDIPKIIPKTHVSSFKKHIANESEADSYI